VNIAVNFLDYSFLVELPYAKAHDKVIHTNCADPKPIAFIPKMTPNQLRYFALGIPSGLYCLYHSTKQLLRLRLSKSKNDVEVILIDRKYVTSENVLNYFGKSFPSIREQVNLFVKSLKATSILTRCSPQKNYLDTAGEDAFLVSIVKKLRSKFL
jgi:ribosome biogenesis protein Nip4